MTDTNAKTLRESREQGKPAAAAGPDTLSESPAGLGVTDSMLNAAYVFEAQLEQMTAWKHQLSQQMELLRRDGIKLLERQKNLAVEKQRLSAEREALTGDRAYVQKLHAEVDAQTKRLAAEGERIEKGLADLKSLETEKGKWESELAAARLAAAAAIQEAELARQRKTDFDAAVAGAESRLAEVRELEARRSALEVQVASAESALSELRIQMQRVEQDRAELQRQGEELARRERSLLEREETEAQCRQNAESALRHQDEQIHVARQEIARERQEIERQRAELAQQTQNAQAQQAEAQASAQAVGGEAQRERAQAQEKLAEARAALEQLAEARTLHNQRAAALDARSQELAAAEEAIRAHERSVAQREQQAAEAKQQAEQAQQTLLGQQQELTRGQQQLAEKIAAAETFLKDQLAAAEKARQDAETQREALTQQRLELDKKLDLMEGELAEQFAAVAKQTKRLTERRADIEARSADVDAHVEAQIARATEALQEQLARAQKTYEDRVQAFKDQVEKTQSAAEEFKTREADLQRTALAATQEAATLRTELARVNEELSEAARGKTQQAELLAEQLLRFEKESAEWQQKLARAIADSGDNEGLKAAAQAASAAQAEVENLRAQVEQAVAGKQDAENRLVAQNARSAEMEKLAEDLVAKLESAEREIADLRRRLESTAAPANPSTNTETAALKKQVEMLELQREDLVGQLFTVQDDMRRRAEEALLSKNVLEAELVDLRNRAESAPRPTDPTAPPGNQSLRTGAGDAARTRLLRQARNLRAYRRQLTETKGALAQNGDELSRQREQLRSRKENLEQVKRLLEKQEMVMARKLADHNALKTVAAVGIFLIMILGSVFFSVYKFVNPLYRSEAVVQLAPPPALKDPDLQPWLLHQMELMRSPDVTFAAWKILRSEAEHYGMHDVREEWISSLNKQLSMQLDGETRTLSIRYVGPNPEGVSQVCNALAAAYVTPALRDGADPSGPGAGAAILAKATIPLSPSQDSRLTLSLAVSAIALFVSLLLVIVFRHYVARQLREIDRMADEQDLADLKGEMA